MKKNTGFTLVEIMIVVLVIGTLATMAATNFNLTRTTARAKLCMNNLRMISAAKDQFTMDSNVVVGADVTLANIAPYLKGGVLPIEPQGGAYTIGVVGANPTCSVGGAHVLP